MKKISVKSPTRVDIAGGTIDLWPITAILGGTSTVNFAITIFTEVEMQERADTKITVELADVDFKKEYASIAELLNDQDPKVQLIRVQAEFFKPAKGFDIKTKSQSPVGGGLGGSSSLCVSLIQAFTHFLDVTLPTEHIVNLAHNLEAQVLGVPTGTQDYYPAVLGGVNVIDYTQLGTKIQKLPVPKDFSEKSFLVYTGKPHNSGLNNWEVLKKFIEKDPNTVTQIKGIRKKARLARDIAVNGQWNKISEVIQSSYSLRTQLSPVFTSPEIEKLKEIVSKLGAYPKICGAGGGGCVLVWCEKGDTAQVRAACQSAGFQILNALPTDQGSQVVVQ